MAGIGFELNKILQRPGITSVAHAYAYAGLIGSGPWLIAVFVLGLLGTVLARFIQVDDVRLFFVSISVTYAITLVVTGPIQVILTRYAADKLFTGETEKIFPAFIWAIAWGSILLTIIGAILFLGTVEGPLLFRLACVSLMTIVGVIWLAGIFLTALKNYNSVVASFAIGFGASFALALIFGHYGKATGAMLGFVLGQTILFLSLCAAIYRELGNDLAPHGEFLPYFKKYQDLAWEGLFYNLGIWIDKFLFWWFDKQAETISGFLHASAIYDRVVYFSLLTIVPGMAVFLLKLETDFARKNESFYQHILKKGTLAQILQVKEEMLQALRDSFSLLVKVQGLVTLILVVSADKVLGLLNLSAVQSGIYQISLIGVFLLVLFLSMQTILYYLDKRKDALKCSIVFTLVNGGFTAWSIMGGERWYGLGFMIATATALVMSVAYVNRHLQRIDYDTFTSQPIYG